MASKRKYLSLEDKISVINEAEKSHASVRKLAEKYGVGKTQISSILKNQNEIKCSFTGAGNINQKKKFPKTEGAALDQIMYDWFSKVRSRNIPMSGTIIKEKAMEVAKELAIDFKGSNGWLEKFIARHNISFKTISGESNNAGVEDFNIWQKKIPEIIKGYLPRDIYNLDETGLFFCALPNKTYSLKGEKCSGGEAANERLTVLFCVNMAGEKENPLVIGKSKNSLCVKNGYVKQLKLTWSSNKKAWMTRAIMTEWLYNFDQKMQEQHRKVLLFLDNAPSHQKLKLQNVKLIFSPSNMECYYQPLDQGIIKSFKEFYRKCIIKRLLSNMDCEIVTLEKDFSIYNALIYIAAAWKNVSTQTIENCFVKSGFCSENESEVLEVSDNFPDEDDIPLSLLISNSNIDYNYVHIDDNLWTESLDVNVSACVKDFLDNNCNDSSDDELKNEELTCNIKHNKQAYETLIQLENYFKMCGDIEKMQSITNLVGAVENDILKNKLLNLKRS